MVTVVREAKGWSQQELATRAGLSQGYVSKIENGLLPLAGLILESVAGQLQRLLACAIAVQLEQAGRIVEDLGAAALMTPPAFERYYLKIGSRISGSLGGCADLC
jgi:transcriptional regulator with XRE-family HTH domain